MAFGQWLEDRIQNQNLGRASGQFGTQVKVFRRPQKSISKQVK